MLGAIIGDIIGSVYEWHNIKTKDFPLFREDCLFTDDTVMTIATADAIMNGGKTDDFIDAYKKWGRLYPNAGYGGRFSGWILSDDREPYSSWGNGSAMRVSPCAEYAFKSLYLGDCPESSVVSARKLARISAGVTHNHPEGIKGAEATTYCMMMAYGYGLKDAKKHIREDIPFLFDYDMTSTLDEIRPSYRFNESCQNTVPQAIIAFLESTCFEDAIRNAISLGGDSDTLAAITGSIAEAAYGVPEDLKEKALTYLDDELRTIYDEWTAFAPLSSGRVYLNYFEVVNTDKAAIKELSDLAVKIVKEHFDPIIGVAQNDYMISKFQSVSSITDQLEQGYKYYFVSDKNGNKLGFLAFCPRENEMYLSKFYLQKHLRGKGISKDMLQFIIKKTKEAGRSSIILNVNKNNSAIYVYEKMGFINVGEEKNYIGNGFFMDDFVYKYLID